MPSRGTLPAALHALVLAPERGRTACQLPMTTPMVAITTQLFDSRHHDTLGLTYVEALALELLCFAVANFWSLSKRPNEQYNARALQALSAVRHALVTQRTPAPTVRQLARPVGLSEKSLERGFKTVYGERPIDFMRNSGYSRH